VIEHNNLCIEMIALGPVATNMYCIWRKGASNCVVFDAPYGAYEALLPILTTHNLNVESLVLTHGHWDHTAGCKEIIIATGCSIHIHPNEQFRLIYPMEHTIWPLPFVIEPIENAQNIEPQNGWECAGVAWDVLLTPGHSEGSVCFYSHEHAVVVVGDTLFEGSIGRTDLPGGNYKTLLQSITEQLLCLPENTLVFPGHGGSTTIGTEQCCNPFLKNLQE
jgi:hydroxyacylglutathione hydrolase